MLPRARHTACFQAPFAFDGDVLGIGRLGQSQPAPRNSPRLDLGSLPSRDGRCSGKPQATTLYGAIRCQICPWCGVMGAWSEN